MIRTSLLAVAALGALAIPLTAASADNGADPAFDAFRSICVATSDDYVAVLKAADASGWREAPGVVPPPTDAAISVTDQAARQNTVGGETLTLLVNRGLQHMKSGDVPETTCRIETSNAHPTAIDRAKGWLGLAPDGGDATLAYFIVTGPPDKLVHVTSSSIPPGGLSIIKVQLESSSAIFVDQRYVSK
jgi:hypothetical protein